MTPLEHQPRICVPPYIDGYVFAVTDWCANIVVDGSIRNSVPFESLSVSALCQCQKILRTMSSLAANKHGDTEDERS